MESSANTSKQLSKIDLCLLEEDKGRGIYYK